MLSKTKGGKWVVKSESGKTLSKPTSKKTATERLRQIEAFKHMKK